MVTSVKSDQPTFQGAVAIDDDRSGSDRREGLHRHLHFGQFDPVSSNLDLLIFAAEKLDDPAG